MFEKFNLLQYSLTHDGKKLTDYILTDLTTRTKIKVGKDALKSFTLHPGETPEFVSNEVYGTPYYHWVIMMINDVFDVYTDWFMTDSQLREYCEKKYNKVVNVTAANVNATTNTFHGAHPFLPNDVVTVTSDNLPAGLNYNTEYYVFNTTESSFQLTPTINSITPVDVSATTESIKFTCNVADLPTYWIDDHDNIMSTTLDMFNGWSNNDSLVVEYKNKITDIINAQPSRRSYVSATNKSIVESSLDVLDIVEEFTPIDQVEQKNYRTLTNFEYESMLNDKKRTVLVLKPEYMKTFIEQFNRVVSS